ncbi:cysteine hydrolase [Altericroceibacterium endophyticum]|uniref:Isochorismatase family protein n=1 Tax=Altericroceibacterium endophyticum TaxID=1808508 RepID=A0A6I4T449_9SPHN|nr:cysteine hydrolase [Altericroceibacterium endophyticum]MXO65022.1 isochorismatase family protein [Altericroceibacterium endophyticum]
MHVTSIPDWAIARGRAMNHFEEIRPARSALVVIDMQRVFMDADQPFGNVHAMDIITPVNTLADAMRAAGGRVIWTRETVSDDPKLAMPEWQYDLSDPVIAAAVNTMRAGTAAHAIHPAMNVAATDITLDKYRYSAFACPAAALETTLSEGDFDMVIIAGTLTNVCCDSTARDANMRGYKVIAASDAMATLSDEEHNAALLNLRLNFADVKSVSEIIALLGRKLINSTIEV